MALLSLTRQKEESYVSLNYNIRGSLTTVHLNIKSVRFYYKMGGLASGCCVCVASLPPLCPLHP